MNFKIEKDINGNPYLVVNVNLTDSDCKGTKFTTLLSNFIFHSDNSGEKFHNLCVRNNGLFHITLLNVPEFSKFLISKRIGNIQIKNQDNILTLLNKDLDDIEFKGIGSISKDDLSTFFIVVNSQKLDAIREKLALKPRDFHITIGFNKKDLFHDRKNKTNIFVV